jgi:cobaltochelatase CobS
MTTKSPVVEEMVMSALKETLAKRKKSETEETSSELIEKAMSIEPEKVETVKFKSNEMSALNFVESYREDIQDFPVTIYKKTDWDEKIAFLIPEKNPLYTLPVNESLDILRAWSIGDNVLIYGPTGSGKSSLIKELCARTNRPFLRINATGDIDSSMIFGQLTAKDGSTIWQDGSVTEAVRYGAVLAWDEWEFTPPEITVGMQWLLEDDRKLFLKEMPGTSKDKFIQPHEAFQIVCLGNTQGQGDMTGHHAGVNVQNTAVLDRFGTVVKLDYLNQAHEKKVILSKIPSFPPEQATMLVTVAELIRQAYKSNQLQLTMSPRTLIGIAKKMKSGLSFADSLKLQYLNKLTDTNQRVAKELIKKVIGDFK